MSLPEPESNAKHPADWPMRETLLLMCPYCRHDTVVPLGRVVTSAVGIRCEYRCSSCSKAFVYLR
jgi:transposase-like protein